MTHFLSRFLSGVLCASACLPLIAQAHSTHTAGAEGGVNDLKMRLRGAALGEWSYNGFEVVQATDPKATPWVPFIKSTEGDVAMFINRRKDIPNSGKGGGAQGTRHPEFALWIFRVSAQNNVEAFDASINQHQMMQASLPVVLGANHAYVLVGVGDLNEGKSQVVALAQALGIPLNRGQ